MNAEERWNILSDLCEREGVKLYEIEPGTVLRVYITSQSSDKSSSVGHTHCAGVSNRILNHDKVELLLPGNTTLEVSSPGINRKLSRPEHYDGAVGERVKVTFRDEKQHKRSVVGILNKVSVVDIEVIVEEQKNSAAVELSIARSNLVEAKIDFPFK